MSISMIACIIKRSRTGSTCPSLPSRESLTRRARGNVRKIVTKVNTKFHIFKKKLFAFTPLPKQKQLLIYITERNKCIRQEVFYLLLVCLLTLYTTFFHRHGTNTHYPTRLCFCFYRKCPWLTKMCNPLEGSAFT